MQIDNYAFVPLQWHIDLKFSLPYRLQSGTNWTLPRAPKTKNSSWKWPSQWTNRWTWSTAAKYTYWTKILLKHAQSVTFIYVRYTVTCTLWARACGRSGNGATSCSSRCPSTPSPSARTRRRSLIPARWWGWMAIPSTTSSRQEVRASASRDVQVRVYSVIQPAK